MLFRGCVSDTRCPYLNETIPLWDYQLSLYHCPPKGEKGSSEACNCHTGMQGTAHTWRPVPARRCEDGCRGRTGGRGRESLQAEPGKCGPGCAKQGRIWQKAVCRPVPTLTGQATRMMLAHLSIPCILTHAACCALQHCEIVACKPLQEALRTETGLRGCTRACPGGFPWPSSWAEAHTAE